MDFLLEEAPDTVEQWLCVASRGSGPVVVIADGAGIHFL